MLLLLILAPSAVFSEEQKSDLLSGDAPIDITADFISYDKETDTYHARGDVVIVQGKVMLRTEEALLDTASGTATAKGGVLVVDEGGSTLTGDTLQMDLKAKTAIVPNARIYYAEENIYITGDPIVKTGPESYAAKKMTYTSCDCEEGTEPAWSFRATSAKVTLGEFLTGWNARFNIKSIPVFYLPYISIPIKTERETGFLQPTVGFSNLRGFIFDNSFFWAISGNTDATFYLDLETNRGLGKGAEYRYIRTRTSYGEALFYHYKEKDIERVRDFRDNLDNLSRPEDASNDRWRLKLKHTEILSGTLNIKANINLVSDDEYFLDFGRGGNERSLESIESNISISKNWGSYSLVGQLRLFNNLLDEDDAETLQRVPEITLTGADKKILSTPFYLSSSSSLISFLREEGAKGQRLDIQPRVSLPLNPGGWFDFTPSIAPRATFYLVEEHPEGHYLDRYLYDIKADLTTTFIRVYQTDMERLKALRHSIRPKLSYTYIPDVDQNELPSFDSVDAITKTNAVTYSLNSTLTGKFFDGGAKSYHTFLTFDLSQTYDINEATRLRTSDEDRRRPFKELTGELILKPDNVTSFSLKGKYDLYDSLFNSFDTSLSTSDKRGDKFNLTYRFIKDSTDYLEASLRVHLNEPLDFTYFQRYSFVENTSLEASYALEYKEQCWSSALTYSERPEDRVIYVVFNLKGIGKIAGFEY